MRNREPITSSPVWDRAGALSRVENDRELLLEILGMFKEDYPQTLATLKSAVNSANFKESCNLSHKLKGMLSNVGAMAAAAAASELESLASAKNASSLTDAYTALEHESNTLLHELDAYLAEVRR